MGIEATVAKFTVQTAVYWGAPIPDGFGQKTFTNPVEISCRWDGDLTLKATSNQQAPGQVEDSHAKVLVTQDLQVGGYLMLGTLNDLDSGEIVPTTIEGAYQIIRFVKTPMVRKTNEFVRTVYV